VPVAAPKGTARSCSADEVHSGAPELAGDDGLDVVVGVGLASVVGDATVGALGDAEVPTLVGDGATGALDPPLQPDTATVASRAQTRPMVRTSRAYGQALAGSSRSPYDGCWR
jgi:hypothetical protein